MSNYSGQAIANALAESHKRVQKFCIVCGMEFWASKNTRALCCEVHRKERHKQQIIEYNARHRVRRMNGVARPSYMQSYRLIHDPDQSWGPNTHLSRKEICDLIENGWLAVGTMFQNGSKVYVVRLEQKALVLAETA